MHVIIKNDACQKMKEKGNKSAGTFVSLCDKFGLEGGFCVIIKKYYLFRSRVRWSGIRRNRVEQ